MQKTSFTNFFKISLISHLCSPTSSLWPYYSLSSYFCWITEIIPWLLSLSPVPHTSVHPAQINPLRILFLVCQSWTQKLYTRRNPNFPACYSKLSAIFPDPTFYLWAYVVCLQYELSGNIHLSRSPEIYFNHFCLCVFVPSHLRAPSTHFHVSLFCCQPQSQSQCTGSLAHSTEKLPLSDDQGIRSCILTPK